MRQAIIWGQEKVVKRLLEAGANPNEPDHYGRTPFSEAISRFDPYVTSRNDGKELAQREQIIDMLIAGGADLEGNIILVLAKCPQYLEKILKAGAVRAINTPTRHGLPLVYAAKYGKWDAVKTLLKYGADHHLIPAGALTSEEMERVISEASYLRRRHALAALGGLPPPSAAAGAGAGASAARSTTAKSKWSKVASKPNAASLQPKVFLDFLV